MMITNAFSLVNVPDYPGEQASVSGFLPVARLPDT